MITVTTDFDHLLEKSRRDDPQLAELMVSTYASYLDRLAYAYLGDPDEAQDTVQEAFIQAARQLHRYQSGTNFRAWLTTITLNLCRDRLRRQKRRLALENVLQRVGLAQPPDSTPEQAYLADEARLRLREAVQQLDEPHRAVVLLRYVQGLPVREIAGVLGIPEGTVFSRLHHAHRQLRRLLDAHPGEGESS